VEWTWEAQDWIADLDGVGDGDGRLVFFGIVVLTHWLVIGLLVSLGALLLVAGAVVRHVWRQRRMVVEESAHLDAQKAQHLELDLALDLLKSTDSKGSERDQSGK
jgi:hypothetical protein